MATLTLNPDEPLKNELIMLIYNIKDEAVLSDLYQMIKSYLTERNDSELLEIAKRNGLSL
ncbi:hypothetical protein [Prevotellamassilia timonensis]|jgi:hypothetical protein|uniref:hypothetical protein n=1 Tax=Prevotellamassilia timonensis TaxID=1852370 RepID=UPI000336C41D|nr:hypothetical protein [Prevotellamassilia timonensis]MDD7439006.1 hypothetical protein [Prevotellamassilia timonensis]CDA45143.1 unknown [Prevotella sp. CAG:5226]